MATEAPELTVRVEKPGAWSRRLTITVPAERIAREKKHVLERHAKRIRVPGFRQGRVPASVLERKFGPALEQEAVEKVIGDAYRQALETEGLQPITQGSVDNIQYEAGRDLTFDVELEVRPEIELERIGGFTIDRQQPPVAEEQVEQVLQRVREEHAVWQAKEGELPVSGDMATVEITPLDAASSAEPGKPRQYQVVIGEGQAVPAVEDAIRTLRAGEEAEFELDLPQQADADPASARAHRMHIRCIEVKSPVFPELDDEFARGVGDFEDLAGLRARIREDLGREAEREAERGVRMQLMQHIMDANAFDVPQSMVGSYLGQLVPEREGADAAQLEQARQELWPAAEHALKRRLIVERIASMEGLHATPAEVDAKIDDLAERLGRPRGELLAQLRKTGRLDELEGEITEEKVFAYLKSLSDIN